MDLALACTDLREVGIERVAEPLGAALKQWPPKGVKRARLFSRKRPKPQETTASVSQRSQFVPFENATTGEPAAPFEK
jgi:hypothetical protein